MYDEELKGNSLIIRWRLKSSPGIRYVVVQRGGGQISVHKSKDDHTIYSVMGLG